VDEKDTSFSMAEIEIRLPKMGESVTEATITNWLKEVGDTVEQDEPLVEVATDKVDNELPSEAEGVLTKILFEKDDVAQVGDVIAIISTDGAAPADSGSDQKATPPSAQDIAASAVKTHIAKTETTTLQKTGPSGKFYSPLVRSIASKEGISIEPVSYTHLTLPTILRVAISDAAALVQNKLTPITQDIHLQRHIKL